MSLVSDFLSQSQLGKDIRFKKSYAPELLFAVPRSLARSELKLDQLNPINHTLPFFGFDIWNAYEAAWLNINRQTQVGVLQIQVPCESPNLFESKSLKLYLQSLRHETFKTSEDYLDLIQKDLSQLCQASVNIKWISHCNHTQVLTPPQGICLDDLSICIKPEEEKIIRSDLLNTHTEIVEETCFTHAFESNCPVTQQPDWASVIIHYQGKKIHHEGLLKYLLSFRHHLGFHEACVEKIFSDILNHCHPQALHVTAHYTRRGGIDINPNRSTSDLFFRFYSKRLPRQ